MPEAVIVSAARSPIGRANKGSLKDFRPDDLSALIIKAALDKVPELDPATINDLMLGCGLPGGESGNNMGRVVATLLGYEIPGTTITRYCSSSVQTSRMAFHAIKAGEGDAFISAGVETVSRFAKGTSDHIPDTRNPLFEEAQQRTDEQAQGGQDWHDPREDGKLPDIYIAMGQTAENVARLRGLDRKELDEFGVRSQNLAEKAIADGFWANEITPVTTPDGTMVSSRRRPARRRHLRGHRRPEAGVPPRRRGHRRQLLRPQRRCCRRDHHVRHQGQGARSHSARPDRLDRRHRPLTRDHGPRTRRGHQAGARSTRT